MVRPIQPEDAARLVEGLHRMSAESRVRRFFYDKAGFTENELHNLTHCDGQSHLALVLGILDESGNEVDTVAVARCFRDRRDPRQGEAAFVTIDEWQRLGVGTALIRELARRCWNAGIRTWKAFHFADNRGARRILAVVGTRTFEQELGSGIVEAIYALNPPEENFESGGVPLRF